MFTVKMGPIPGLPAWHQQSTGCAYQFPTVEAARRFAGTHAERDPGRNITVEEV